ncbi:hypothetical protein HK100_012367 [Physocladia obscura]|uniref:Uncharacterized protein n=1 Tax=Physocladia obscura TaxID=109957 RepID=A0AAD5T0G2_9FUNG|nr:hypothetical protein HK100_012367 [Physocladia obscura]
MVESKRRLEFLEGLLRDLQAKAQSNYSVISKSSSEGTITNPIPTISSFELIKYGNAITIEKVRFCLNEIIHKLETEKSLRAGTESLMSAFNELKERLFESNTKIDALEKARRRYNALYVPSINDQEDFLGELRKSTGRLKFKLIGVSNLMGRTEIENEIVAKVFIDGNTRYTTRHLALGRNTCNTRGPES